MTPIPMLKSVFHHYLNYSNILSQAKWSSLSKFMSPSNLTRKRHFSTKICLRMELNKIIDTPPQIQWKCICKIYKILRHRRDHKKMEIETGTTHLQVLLWATRGMGGKKDPPQTLGRTTDQ